MAVGMRMAGSNGSLRRRVFMHLERLLVPLVSEPVHGLEDLAAGDEPLLEAVLAGDIEEHDADEDGKEPLAGHGEEDDADDHEQRPEKVLDDAEGDADSLVVRPRRAVGVREVVGGEKYDKDTRGEEAADEHDDGAGGEPDGEVAVFAEPVEHGCIVREWGDGQAGIGMNWW